MIRYATLIAACLVILALAAPGSTFAAPECNLVQRSDCFGIESVKTSLSKTRAGDHPDITIQAEVKQDPLSKPNVFGLKNSYATTRHLRFNLPPGLVGNPNVLDIPQQCTAQELITATTEPGAPGCPNGSQIGVATVSAYQLTQQFREPIYMMQPPGGDAVGRLGTFAGPYPVFLEVYVRSESDYGFVSEVRDAPAAAGLVALQSTLWGVPSASAHDRERCTPGEALDGCVISDFRPPGSRKLAFWTNPTRCGVPLQMGVNAASWLRPEFLETSEAETSFQTITGCDKLPFGPNLTVEPTSHRPSSPTGLDITIRLDASDGVNVLEPSHMRDIRIDLPAGLAINTNSADGIGVCSADQVRIGKREDAHCPDSAKMASTEFDVPIAERRLKGAIYLREPEPGNPFRVWVVADDLGAHVKLEGQLDVDKTIGQIKSVVLDSPQFPLREAKLEFKSGFRAPLVNPSSCGTYFTHYEFTPWSGTPPAKGDVPMTIDEGCDGLGGFAPKLSAGSTTPAAAHHTPFTFTLTREDGEQNPVGFDVSLPRGFAASFAGILHCEGAAAQMGTCPAGSRIGRVTAAIGSGPAPLWVPQPGKRPSAIYLSGPYKGAPTSIVAVVPRQAGPFDFGDEVVRSAIYINPVTARATAKTDSLPQMIEGIPLRYRTLNVELDRPGFALNPTSCAPKQTEALITSTEGAIARSNSPFEATNCAKLDFKPTLSFRLFGGTHRGSHPRLKSVLRMSAGGANLAAASVTLPRSEFVENAHFKTICTRVQFAAKACPAGSIYGFAKVTSPLFDETFSGPVYLRSSSNPLPDLVISLKGPESLPIEIQAAARIDSVRGCCLRATFSELPDAPFTATLQMQGGKKGLIVNSRNLCAATNRADVELGAQSGKKATLHPALQISCKKGAGESGRHRRSGH